MLCDFLSIIIIIIIVIANKMAFDFIRYFTLYLIRIKL